MSGLDCAKVEADFAVLLAKGWPQPVEHQRRAPTCIVEATGSILLAFAMISARLINSSVPSTRTFWRQKLGLRLEDEASS